jgi:hypothetical protein
LSVAINHGLQINYWIGDKFMDRPINYELAIN